MRDSDTDTQPTGERRDDQEQQRQQPKATGEQSPATTDVPGLKDKEAKTSDSYGHTRDAGERP